MAIRFLVVHITVAALAFLVGFGIARRAYRPVADGAPEGAVATQNKKGAVSSSGAASDGGLNFFPPLSSPSQTANAEKNALSITDQRPGEEVTVTAAVLAEDAWLTVHEVLEGAPGNILGAARFRAGEHKDVRIPLLRQTAGGSRYSVMLHRDNGDDVFMLEEDVPMKDASGNVPMAEFAAIGSPSQR